MQGYTWLIWKEKLYWTLDNRFTPPPLNYYKYSNNWYQSFGACEDILKGVQLNIAMYKKEIPK